jgi:hypothetical protein
VASPFGDPPAVVPCQHVRDVLCPHAPNRAPGTTVI